MNIKNLKNILVIIFCLVAFVSIGGDIHVRVVPVADGQRIYVGQRFDFNGDTVRISQLRFYLSEITFLKGEDTVWTEPEGYRLMSIADTSSLSFSAYLPQENEFDAIRFRLGVDSVSSSTGAHTGALDPVHGMYWAWHTGYVNLKLEGSCGRCPLPQKGFELHIGGFQDPFDAERTITLQASGTDLNLYFDIGPILNAAFSNQAFRIMTPGSKAMHIADVASQSFRFE
jgi:hypothetical protein